MPIDMDTDRARVRLAALIMNSDTIYVVERSRQTVFDGGRHSHVRLELEIAAPMTLWTANDLNPDVIRTALELIEHADGLGRKFQLSTKAGLPKTPLEQRLERAALSLFDRARIPR